MSKQKAWTFGPAIAWLLMACVAVIAMLFFVKPWPNWLLALNAWAVLLVSPVSFGMFWLDKRAAEKSARRVPEKVLHLSSLLGGWPGAVIAQQLLRHKSAKQSFRLTLLAIVLVHMIVTCFLFYGWLQAS